MAMVMKRKRSMTSSSHKCPINDAWMNQEAVLQPLTWHTHPTWAIRLFSIPLPICRTWEYRFPFSMRLPFSQRCWGSDCEDTNNQNQLLHKNPNQWASRDFCGCWAWCWWSEDRGRQTHGCEFVKEYQKSEQNAQKSSHQEPHQQVVSIHLEVELSHSCKIEE